MTNEQCTPFLENIPAYALGALDADESYALELHLHSCASCQAELASYRIVGENLLLATPPQSPPAELRKRLQARLPSAQKTIQRRKTSLIDQLRLSQLNFGKLGLAGAIVLLLVMNLFSFLQIQSLQTQQKHLLSQVETSQTALAILSYPETQTYHLEEVVGTLLLDKERNVALLTAWNLPQLSKDQIYQIWLIDSQGGRTSAGLFQAEGDLPFTSVSILPNSEISHYVGIGVTVEPEGGSNQPTGERVFKVDF